jgi:ABC-type multidrug transport system ATPase subunit
MRVELRSVLKAYKATRALDHVSLTFEQGQIVSLLGPNGAGKTTLLRCLVGIAAPDKGTIYFDDAEFRRDKVELRQRMFILPDFPPLFWEQSVLRNLSIILHLYGVDNDGMEARIVELLRDFDLLPLALRPVNTLSRGQAYKVALVALIACDRELWLLDEPFASGIDPHGIDALKRHARAAAERGRIVIYSTQILDVAERFSDRVCVIHQGNVRAFDSLENLRAQAQDKNHVLEGIFRSLRETT